MPREDWKEALADFEALYRKTCNPLYAWWAIHLTANTGELEIPGWCEEYLATCASRIIGAAFDSTTTASEKAKSIPVILDMGGQGKNCFKAFDSDAMAAATAERLTVEKAAYG